MKDIAAWACDCICYCNCDCVAPLCDCSVCNCDCDCQTPNQDIRETLVKSGIDAKNLNAKYGQVVEILKNIK
ncbi:MAG: hypothetical protein Q8920_13100 [Bacillota bacterium]|nr:hypothetical protein [Bacillota bacterium]